MPSASPVDRIHHAFRSKRVFVTGHTGFKGAWLSAWLGSMGASVAGLSLAPDDGQRELFGLASEIVTFDHSHIGDIRDVDLVNSAIGDYSPDVVFHLAAQPLVRLSYENPVETFDVNVRGTATVLDAVRLHNVPVAVCVTTDKCYENNEQIWPYRETDPMGGWDPYSASKGAAELVVQSYRRSFFPDGGATACASARAGNVVGGGDQGVDRLLPDVYRAMKSDAPIVLRSPNSTRPWQHVLESLSGYLTLGAALVESGTDFASAWNFGPFPNESVSVRDFVDAVLAVLGDDAPKVEMHADGPHEATLLALDITKAATQLNWRPALTTSDRANLTAAWMLHQHRGTLRSQLIADQIAAFETRWSS